MRKTPARLCVDSAFPYFYGVATTLTTDNREDAALQRDRPDHQLTSKSYAFAAHTTHAKFNAYPASRSHLHGLSLLEERHSIFAYPLLVSVSQQKILSH